MKDLAPELLALRVKKFFTDKKYDQLDSMIQAMDDRSLELRTIAERAIETSNRIDRIRYDLNVYVTNKDPVATKKTEVMYEEFDQSDFDTVSVRLMKK